MGTFGDNSFETEPFGNFELLHAALPSEKPYDEDSAVDAREIPLVMARFKYKHATSDVEKAKAATEIQAIEAARAADELVFGNIVQQLCGNSKDCIEKLQQQRSDMIDMDCHVELVK